MVDVARHIDIVKILETSPSVVLLRTRACHIIVEFLTSIFDESMVVSYENIHSRLADFLNDNNVEIDEENDSKRPKMTY